MTNHQTAPRTADARMDTPAALTQLTREYALDGETGTRKYTRVYNGKAYVVTVERGDHFVDANKMIEPSDAEPVGWILRSPADNPWRSHLSYHKPDDDLYYPVYRHPASVEISLDDYGPGMAGKAIDVTANGKIIARAHLLDLLPETAVALLESEGDRD